MLSRCARLQCACVDFFPISRALRMMLILSSVPLGAGWRTRAQVPCSRLPRFSIGFLQISLCVRGHTYLLLHISQDARMVACCVRRTAASLPGAFSVVSRLSRACLSVGRLLGYNARQASTFS